MGQRTFDLRTNFCEYTNDELNENLFENILSGFNTTVWDFIVLSPNEPIEDSTFIQIGAPQKITENKFTRKSSVKPLALAMGI